MFFLSSPDSLIPSIMGFFFFIFPFLLHLSPPHVDQIAGSDLCPISPFLKSLWVAIRLNVTVQVSPPH